MFDGYSEIDYGFWIKFVILMGILVIIPVWIFRLIDLSFLYKILFTLAGGVGLWIGLKGKTMRMHR